MAATEEKLEAYVQQLVDPMEVRLTNVLGNIRNKYRHLLAVRGYTRFADRIDTRWPWTEAEGLTFQASSEGEAMEREKRSIFREFASRHSGYTLSANMEPRSLTSQRNSWNSNDTVLALGKRLWVLARRELDNNSTYPETPTEASIIAFRTWIARNPGALGLRVTVLRTVDGERVRVTVRSPTNATPGLSSHGRLQALDFIVRRRGRVIAAARSGQRNTVWRGDINWRNRLRNAINAVRPSIRDHWDGPLRSPDEPWHYTYTP